MSEPDDVLREFLEALRTGQGDPRFVALGKAFEEAEKGRIGKPDRAEARAWLASNPRPRPFAVNRFQDRTVVERFVEQLYELGAREVFIENIEYEEVESFGGPYSDSMAVELPIDAAARTQIMALCRQHCVYIDDASKDLGQGPLHLWWD